jgi:hypothetical protein
MQNVKCKIDVPASVFAFCILHFAFAPAAAAQWTAHPSDGVSMTLTRAGLMAGSVKG